MKSPSWMPAKVTGVCASQKHKVVTLKRWRRTEIRVERREVTVIVTGGKNAAHRCPHCEGSPALVGASDAARALGIDQPALLALLESRHIHGDRSSDGQLLICAESIARKE
jgi:hypothetical protein